MKRETLAYRLKAGYCVASISLHSAAAEHPRGRESDARRGPDDVHRIHTDRMEENDLTNSLLSCGEHADTMSALRKPFEMSVDNLHVHELP